MAVTSAISQMRMTNLTSPFFFNNFLDEKSSRILPTTTSFAITSGVAVMSMAMLIEWMVNTSLTPKPKINRRQKKKSFDRKERRKTGRKKQRIKKKRPSHQHQEPESFPVLGNDFEYFDYHEFPRLHSDPNHEQNYLGENNVQSFPGLPGEEEANGGVQKRPVSSVYENEELFTPQEVVNYEDYPKSINEVLDQGFKLDFSKITKPFNEYHLENFEEDAINSQETTTRGIQDALYYGDVPISTRNDNDNVLLDQLERYPNQHIILPPQEQPSNPMTGDPPLQPQDYSLDYYEYSDIADLNALKTAEYGNDIYDMYDIDKLMRELEDEPPLHPDNFHWDAITLSEVNNDGLSISPEYQRQKMEKQHPDTDHDGHIGPVEESLIKDVDQYDIVKQSTTSSTKPHAFEPTPPTEETTIKNVEKSPVNHFPNFPPKDELASKNPSFKTALAKRKKPLPSKKLRQLLQKENKHKRRKVTPLSRTLALPDQIQDSNEHVTRNQRKSMGYFGKPKNLPKSGLIGSVFSQLPKLMGHNVPKVIKPTKFVPESQVPILTPPFPNMRDDQGVFLNRQHDTAEKETILDDFVMDYIKQRLGHLEKPRRIHEMTKFVLADLSRKKQQPKTPDYLIPDIESALEAFQRQSYNRNQIRGRKRVKRQDSLTSDFKKEQETMFGSVDDDDPHQIMDKLMKTNSVLLQKVLAREDIYQIFSEEELEHTPKSFAENQSKQKRRDGETLEEDFELYDDTAKHREIDQVDYGIVDFTKVAYEASTTTSPDIHTTSSRYPIPLSVLTDELQKRLATPTQTEVQTSVITSTPATTSTTSSTVIPDLFVTISPEQNNSGSFVKNVPLIGGWLQNLSEYQHNPNVMGPIYAVLAGLGVTGALMGVEAASKTLGLIGGRRSDPGAAHKHHKKKLHQNRKNIYASKLDTQGDDYYEYIDTFPNVAKIDDANYDTDVDKLLSSMDFKKLDYSNYDYDEFGNIDMTSGNVVRERDPVANEVKKKRVRPRQRKRRRNQNRRHRRRNQEKKREGGVDTWLSIPDISSVVQKTKNSILHFLPN